MKPLRAVADASELPSVTFGSRSLMWWGTLGFMTIEGWTTAILVASYLYLRQGSATWPPPRTPNPSLLVPSINLVLMFVSIVPAVLAARAAKRLDTLGVRRWMAVMCAIVVLIVVLRWWELWALNTRWDTSAYGSAAWTVVGFHTSLLLLDVLDTLGETWFFFTRKLPTKSFSGLVDNSFYWYFTVGLWIPIYLILYVGPRIV